MSTLLYYDIYKKKSPVLMRPYCKSVSSLRKLDSVYGEKKLSLESTFTENHMLKWISTTHLWLRRSHIRSRAEWGGFGSKSRAGSSSTFIGKVQIYILMFNSWYLPKVLIWGCHWKWPLLMQFELLKYVAGLHCIIIVLFIYRAILLS